MAEAAERTLKVGDAGQGNLSDQYNKGISRNKNDAYFTRSFKLHHVRGCKNATERNAKVITRRSNSDFMNLPKLN